MWDLYTEAAFYMKKNRVDKLSIFILKIAKKIQRQKSAKYLGENARAAFYMVDSFSLRVGYWKLFLSGFSTGPSSSINSRIATGERLRDSRKRTQ